MSDRPLTLVALVACIACCAGTAIAAVLLGGVALASLGRFGLVSAATLIAVVVVAWVIDRLRADAGSDAPAKKMH